MCGGKENLWFESYFNAMNSLFTEFHDLCFPHHLSVLPLLMAKKTTKSADLKNDIQFAAICEFFSL